MNAEKQKIAQKIDNIFDENSQVKKLIFRHKLGQIEFYYVETLVDKVLFSNAILIPFQSFLSSDKGDYKNLLEILKNQIFAVSSSEITSDLKTIQKNILSGFVAVCFNDKCLCLPIPSVSKRGIEEPPTSRVIKGPREGFIEDIVANIGLVRKRIKTPDLKVEDVFVGRQTATRVSIVYIKGIAKNDLVLELKKKLKSIKIDAIIDSYYIESLLEGNQIKFFRRVGNTEKPDIFSAKIVEGRIGILVDGSPIALTVPFLLYEDLQSCQDYYSIPAVATFSRILRFVGLIFAILVPGVYVALQNYNYRILPINFLITLLSSIEGLSIPPIVEILIVLFLFEIITEASVQMPNSLGMALSIIGALALGNTAVDAGIISPPSIVVIAVSSVTLYIIPDQISETRLLRILFTILGGVIGLYGVLIGTIILSTYLCSIESFGVPYMAPYGPNIPKDLKDGLVKRPLEKMISRPKLIAAENKTRQRGNLE